MRKILVLGCGGAGKSTFARKLGDALQIEVLHLDAFYWKSGWIEPENDEWIDTIDSLLKRDAWIMDGNYGSSIERRAVVCDTIIFLDRSRWICLWRVLKRRVKYRNKIRPDVAPGCPEKINWEFIAWIWGYRKHTKPRVDDIIGRAGTGRQVFRLTSEKQIDEFFESLKIG